MNNLIRYWFVFCLLILSAGCASTQVNKAHSMWAKTGVAAEVFFLRPSSERPMGVGDNSIQIDIDDEYLLDLQKRQYIGVFLEAGNMNISVHTLAQVGATATLKVLLRKEFFSFKSGQRYYVLMKMIDGEFRGLSYAPVIISENEAARLIKTLKPIGEAAIQLKQSLKAR